MNAIFILTTIVVLLLAAAWLALAGATVAAFWLLFKLIDWLRGIYIAHRNERQVRSEMRMRRGFRELRRRGWVKEDLR